MHYPQFVPAACQMPSDASIDYQCHDPQSSTFFDETMFEDKPETTSSEALPDGAFELSLEKSLDAFIDNFAEVQQN